MIIARILGTVVSTQKDERGATIAPAPGNLERVLFKLLVQRDGILACEALMFNNQCLGRYLRVGLRSIRVNTYIELIAIPGTGRGDR